MSLNAQNSGQLKRRKQPLQIQLEDEGLEGALVFLTRSSDIFALTTCIAFGKQRPDGISYQPWRAMAVSLGGL